MDEITSRLVTRLDELGQISDEPEHLVRTFLSPAHRRANHRVGEWMRAAGLEVHEDAFGNLIGHRAGPPGSRTLLIGSHLDTVIEAGRFDGALGVLLGISLAESLRELPFNLEIIGFADEEGVRFQSTYLGSRGYAGLLTPEELARCDAAGMSVAEALQAARLPGEQPRPFREVLGYLEVHIEQGPVLEAQDAALGVVMAIAGQTRAQAGFTGLAGHAGTVPMALRQDALAGAAEMIVATESYAKNHPPLVATVGSIQVAPGASNVIPGRASFTLDVRSPGDDDRALALRQLGVLGAEIATRRDLVWTWEEKQSTAAVACDPTWTAALAAAVQKEQATVPQLFSGAGHDAVVMAALAPTAMLFVRCRGGLSHHPDEYAAPEDIATALRAVIQFVHDLARLEDM